MQQFKAFRILSSLNEQEYAEFNRFINSPYFNRSKELVKFFTKVKNYYPAFDNSSLQPEKIYKKLYPQKVFNEGTIKNLFTDLGNIAERFLAYVNYEQTFRYGYNIIEETNRRKLDKEFLKNYKKNYERNEIKEDAISEKNLNKYFLEAEMWNYNQRLNIEITKEEFNSLSEALFTFFLNQFFNTQLSQVNVANWYNKKKDYNILSTFFEFTNVDAIIKRMEEAGSSYYNDVKLMYHLSKAAKSNENDFYGNLDSAIKIFNEQIGGMNEQTQHRLYISAINIINMYIKASDKNLGKLKVELEKQMIDKKIGFDSKGMMHAAMYSHILHDAICAEEFEWAKEFLETYIDSVLDEAKFKYDIYYYYKAKLLSLDKKYIESNEVLLKVSKDDDTIKATSRVLKMINFYELGDIESGFAQADAFKQMIIRNDEANIGRKDLNANFLKFYLMLLRIKTGKEADILFAKKELAECAVIRSKVWLMEKYNELD